MSAMLARASEQTTLFLTCLAISLTAWKSPSRGDREAGFDDVDAHLLEHLGDAQLLARPFIEQPGDCSPSRRVVSKMMMRSSDRSAERSSEMWASERTLVGSADMARFLSVAGELRWFTRPLSTRDVLVRLRGR